MPVRVLIINSFPALYRDSDECLEDVTVGDLTMFGLGVPEVAIIVLVAIIIFGPKKIPEIGSALGKTIRGFKEEMDNPQLNDGQEKDHDS
jgi:sec-independent protein translocase protein TatA